MGAFLAKRVTADRDCLHEEVLLLNRVLEEKNRLLDEKNDRIFRLQRTIESLRRSPEVLKRTRERSTWSAPSNRPRTLPHAATFV